MDLNIKHLGPKNVSHFYVWKEKNVVSAHDCKTTHPAFLLGVLIPGGPESIMMLLSNLACAYIY